MPTFPTYDGELPQCLNPLNPRHYLLVLYWIFFRPTALKCYLYQAEPLLDGFPQLFGSKILHQFKNPRLRNLILIATAIPVLSRILGICISYFYFGNINAESAILVNPISFIATVYSMLVGTIAAWFPGIILSGLTSELLFELVVYQDHISASFIILLIGFFVYTLFIWSSPVGRFIGNLLNIFGITWLCSTILNDNSSQFLRAFLPFSIKEIIIFLIGFSRLPTYLLECLILLRVNTNKKSHPIVWDELNIFPFFSGVSYVYNNLRQDRNRALRDIAKIFNNPFQTWVIYNSLIKYLMQSQSPIEDIYFLMVADELDCYTRIPSSEFDWLYGPSVRFSLFSELADVMPLPSEVLSKSRYSLKKFLTHFLRYKNDQNFVPIRMLILLVVYTLRGELYSRISIINHPRQKLYKDQMSNLDDLFYSKFSLSQRIGQYPYGLEVYESLNTLVSYFKFQKPQQIATAPTHLTWLNPTNTFLRPTVIQALQTLSQIGQEINRANIASSHINQLSAFSRANEQLQQLTIYVTEYVHPNYPEQKLLLRIIDQWQNILTPAAGALGRAELLEPIENPYIAGPPVTGNLFVGREDILTTIEELWLKPGQVESVVLFGHRRMGKTSILRNLADRFTPTTKIINFNIQTLGTLTTPQLILALAQTIYDDLPTHIQIPEPTQADFPTPESDFRHWLKKLETHRQPDDRFIIAIDEFELIEQGIKAGRLSPSLIGHWRGILNDFPWIIFAFAGLHTLQEMTQDYWNPLFGSVRKIPVTYLTQAAATRLITNPSEDFPIDYDADAIAQIYSLTNGQPYLTQLICQNLISRFNRQRFEEQREIEPRFTTHDIQTIITEPNFFNDGNAYFRGIWEQAQETSGPTQLAILRELATAPTANLQAQEAEDFALALDLLLTHDVIHQDDQSRYSYRVELMRQWVQKTLPN
jgi:hypothetical protein